MAKVKRVIVVGIDGLQLCQVERYAREGCLPNLKKLMETGSSGEFLPELPAWTPTNWGTIATGALPGSTMLAGWHRRNADDLEGKWDVSTFSSRSCPVETIWEAAEKTGLKTLSIFHPLTWPPRTRKGMVVAPLYSGPGIIPLDISRGRIWSTRIERAERIDVRQENGTYIAETEIAPSAIELAKEFNFGDKPEEARENVPPGKSVNVKIEFKPGENAARIQTDNASLTARKGEWTDWVTFDFGERGKGTVQFYLFSCEPESEYGLTLAHSAIYPTEGFAYPEELCPGILENVGPFLSNPIRPPGREGDSVFFDCYRYQGLWMARTAKYLLETQGWDLYYQHYHVIDSATHHFLNQADPEGGGYDPAEADYYVDCMRRSYAITDEVVGEFMKIMDENTVLIVLSDHGNIPNKWAVDYARVLESAGLLALDEKKGILWEKTQAFMIPQRISDIYINLRGRYPKGIVDPEDYEEVQEKIIDALLDLRNPDGKRVVAYALKGKDAQIVNFYGPECGDVVFVFNAFHGRTGLPKGETVIRAKAGANHGPQIATTRTEFSSDLACGFFAGPGIRRGYVRDFENNGLWKLIDVVPTISHMMGFAPPKDSRGAVLPDLFE